MKIDMQYILGDQQTIGEIDAITVFTYSDSDVLEHTFGPFDASDASFAPVSAVLNAYYPPADIRTELLRQVHLQLETVGPNSPELATTNTLFMYLVSKYFGQGHNLHGDPFPTYPPPFDVTQYLPLPDPVGGVCICCQHGVRV